MSEMTLEQFNALVDEIMAAGVGSEEQAADFAARIGDTPELDEDGLVVIRGDSQEIIRRINLPSFAA